MRQSKLFPSLALTTSLLTLGLIVFGAIVRVTDSGLGCGNDWPLCNGTIFPPLDNVTAWIEWLHRLFALLIGLLGLGMLAASWVTYRKLRPAVFIVTIIAAVIYILVATLGRYVVKTDLQPSLVTVHLGTAMLLLGALLSTSILAVYNPVENYKSDHVTALIYINTVLSLIIILTGALVRGSGADLACVDWPLCNGELFPFTQGQLQKVHMIHRYAVLALGITLAMLTWFVLHDRKSQQIRTLATLAFVGYLMQAGVGAMFVLSGADALWGAAHVGLAAATWALLVALSVIETLNTRSETGTHKENAWQGQSEAISN